MRQTWEGVLSIAILFHTFHLCVCVCFVPRSSCALWAERRILLLVQVCLLSCPYLLRTVAFRACASNLCSVSRNARFSACMREDSSTRSHPAYLMQNSTPMAVDGRTCGAVTTQRIARVWLQTTCTPLWMPLCKHSFKLLFARLIESGVKFYFERHAYTRVEVQRGMSPPVW